MKNKSKKDPRTASVSNRNIRELRVGEAMAAANRGWILTPLNGKVPFVRGWQNEPAPDEKTLKEWARAGNLGLRTGSASSVFVVDEDSAKGGDISEVFGDVPVTPTVITGSRGKHYYFRTPDPCPGNSASKLAPHIDTRGEGGQVVYPGSVHPETDQVYRWADGRSPDDVPLAPIPDEIMVKLKRPTGERSASNQCTGQSSPYGKAALREEAEAVRTAAEGNRNDKLNHSAFALGQLIAGGELPREIVEDGLLEAAIDSGLREEEARSTISSGLEAGMKRPRKRSNRNDEHGAPSRPVIVIRAEVADVTDEAEEALFTDPTAGIYVRGNMLVRVVRDGAKRLKKLERPPNAPTIIPAEIPWLRERMDRAADWVRYKDGAPAPAMPPLWVAKTLAARAEWRFPPLEGVIETPYFSSDGAIVHRRGYDSRTGMLYDPGELRFPSIPEKPTPADAGRALLILTNPFQDFPFVSEADEAAVIAAILTILARPAIAGPCPVFAFRAPAPGSGKSLLADAVSLIATGRPAAKMAPPRDDEEARKLILAIALECSSVVVIDNVSGLFGSEALAAATTAETWSGRVLGTNKTVTLPLRAVWMVTGNNISFRGDLGRRVVLCDIDPPYDHPEDRTTFKHRDLIAHIRKERPRFVVAALTVLRAYHVAGRPLHDKPRKGSFERWDSLIRGALLFAGMADPLASSDRIRDEADADLDVLRQALGAWEASLGAEPVTAAHAIQRTSEKDHTELGAALAGLAGCTVAGLDARRLGNALRRVRGRRVTGRRFESDGSTRTGVKVWYVASAESQR